MNIYFVDCKSKTERNLLANPDDISPMLFIDSILELCSKDQSKPADDLVLVGILKWRSLEL